MDSFEHALNELLVSTFRKILRYEEQAVQRSYGSFLSMSELHMIEAIGKDNNRPKSVGEIAQDLNITLSSVTIAVNKLEKKGLLVKEKSERDKRSVFVDLTELGLAENKKHQRFHTLMIERVTHGLTEEEKAVMTSGIKKINAFFASRENRESR